MRFLTLQKIFSLALFFGIAGLCSAQVPNDRCENATVITLGADSGQCTPVSGTTVGAEDATLIAGPIVCSGTWYSDDVWFQFTTDANPPVNGINVESILGAGDAPELGMAVYDGCDPTNEPFDCFSDSPGRRTLTIVGSCIQPNTTYYVRCWSTGDPNGGAPNLNAGTFGICAYGADAPEPSTDVIIFSEDFSDGPGDFTTNPGPDVEGDCIHDWIWDEDGSVLTYGNTQAGTITLASSACNGAMGFPAGYYQTFCSGLIGDIPPDYTQYIDFTAQLLSPSIDLSENACVSVKWNENFQGLNPSTQSSWGSYFEYSIDGGENWLGIDLNETDDRNIEYIREREFPLFGAGGQSDVRLRFTFDGDFYWWIIDNIQVIERKDNDMRAQANFYAIAPLSTMPVTQVDDVRFLIDVLNRGCDTQTNTVVNCNCVDAAGTVVFNEDLAYGSISSDSLAQNKEFSTRFSPPAVVNTYTCTYTVNADEMDDNPGDNSQSFTFNVSDDLQFRKEEGSTRGLFPLVASFWEEGEPHSWEIGNVFYATSSTDLAGNQLVFETVDFQVNNPETLGGQLINAWLYKITDNDFNGIIDKQDPGEIQRLAVGEYTFTGFEVATDMITVPIEFFNSSADLEIQENTHYFVSIEFPTQLIDVDMIIAASEEFDYSAAMFLTRTLDSPEITPPTSVNDIRYSHGFGIGKEGTLRFQPTNDITTLNFGDDLVPVVRLNFVPNIVSTNNLSEDIAIDVYPNPASTEINLNLDITETAKELTVQIVDISGKIVLSREYDNINSMKEAYNISNLSDGIYFMHINSAQGIQTQRFVVAK